MSEAKPTGLAIMEARTDAALEVNRIERAIEARATSPEVSLLNDMAQLEIFGSAGRTYTDPETGAVIATPERPIMGKLDDIKKNPKYGKTQADRDASAEEYSSDVENLLGEGYELCQVKMIMDMRESDIEGRATRTAKLIAGGLGAVEADNKARAEYEKKDATRTRLIKEGGAFTVDDYEKVRKGESLYPVIPLAKEIEEHKPADKVTDEPKKGPELESEFQEVLDIARKNLAKLSAEMRRRTAPREALREEYAAALAAYDEAYRAAGARAVELLREAGLEEKDVRSLVVEGVISEKLAFDREQQDYVKQTSEKFWNRKLGKFTDFWARSGTVKRMIVGGVVGAGMAVVTAGALTTAGVGGLVAGAAALSTRVARSLMISKVSKDAAHKNAYDVKQEKDLGEVRSYIHEVVKTPHDSDESLVENATLLVGDSVDRRVMQDQHQNRKRLGTALIGIAAGAGIGLIADNIYHSPIETNGGNKGGTPRELGGGQNGGGVHTPETTTTSTTTTLGGARPGNGGGTGNVGGVRPGGASLEPVKLDVSDTRLPWTHMTEAIGSNGTPKILELVKIGEQHGWHFEGNGQGGGNGSILSVKTPDGRVFTDNGNINAALDHIRRSYNS